MKYKLLVFIVLLFSLFSCEIHEEQEKINIANFFQPKEGFWFYKGDDIEIKLVIESDLKKISNIFFHCNNELIMEIQSNLFYCNSDKLRIGKNLLEIKNEEDQVLDSTFIFVIDNKAKSLTPGNKFVLGYYADDVDGYSPDQRYFIIETVLDSQKIIETDTFSILNKVHYDYLNDRITYSELIYQKAELDILYDVNKNIIYDLSNHSDSVNLFNFKLPMTCYSYDYSDPDPEVYSYVNFGECKYSRTFGEYDFRGTYGYIMDFLWDRQKGLRGAYIDGVLFGDTTTFTIN